MPYLALVYVKGVVDIPIQSNKNHVNKLVFSFQGLFSRCRMFLMTEGPHLYYVDSQHMVLKGEVPWSKDLRPEPKKFKIFFIHTVSLFMFCVDKIWFKLIPRCMYMYCNC
jgi:hypothetical protein